MNVSEEIIKELGIKRYAVSIKDKIEEKHDITNKEKMLKVLEKYIHNKLSGNEKLANLVEALKDQKTNEKVIDDVYKIIFKEEYSFFGLIDKYLKDASLSTNKQLTAFVIAAIEQADLSKIESLEKYLTDCLCETFIFHIETEIGKLFGTSVLIKGQQREFSPSKLRTANSDNSTELKEQYAMTYKLLSQFRDADTLNRLKVYLRTKIITIIKGLNYE